MKDTNQFTKLRAEFDRSYSITSGLKDNYSKRIFEGSKPVRLSDFKTKDGIVRSRISKDIREYANHLEELPKLCVPLYDVLKVQCREFMEDIEKACDSLNKISESLKHLG